MTWYVERIINFSPESRFRDGLAHLGFHSAGRYYALSYDQHWIAEVSPDGAFLWTAGPEEVPGSPTHIPLDLHRPVFANGSHDGTVLVMSGGNRMVYKIFPSSRSACVIVDGPALGISEMGNCVLDADDNIWINEIMGRRVLKFNASGAALLALGSGASGFQPGVVSFGAVRFNWVYDLRVGPDGMIYVLDSKNFAVRRIDPRAETVETIAGTGQPGYSGDGGDARQAMFGGDATAQFDGPWAMALDEVGTVYVGDTHNHVVRAIHPVTGLIETLAGSVEVRVGERNSADVRDPLQLNLPRICSLDYADGRLYVPEWDGDLVVLRRDSI